MSLGSLQLGMLAASVLSPAAAAADTTTTATTIGEREEEKLAKLDNLAVIASVERVLSGEAELHFSGECEGEKKKRGKVLPWLACPNALCSLLPSVGCRTWKKGRKRGRADDIFSKPPEHGRKKGDKCVRMVTN